MTHAEAHIHALNAEVAATVAEVEGMKALNTERERHGHAQAYDEAAFQKKANELRSLAFHIRELVERLQ